MSNEPELMEYDSAANSNANAKLGSAPDGVGIEFRLKPQPTAWLRARPYDVSVMSRSYYHYDSRSSPEKFLQCFSEDASAFKGTFPHQTISLDLLLGDKSLSGENHGILSQTRSKDKVRYFHIPHNNMKVRSNHSKSVARLG